MQVMIPKSFVLIFTIGLLLTSGILGNLKEGNADVGNTLETATLLALDTEYTEDIKPANDEDYFQIVVARKGKLTVWTTGELDTVGELQNIYGVSHNT